MARVLLLLAFALSSCVPQWTYVQDTGSTLPRVEFCASDDLPHRVEVAEAVAAWAYATRGWAKIELTHTPGCMFEVKEVDSNPCQTPDALACVPMLGAGPVQMIRGRWDVDPQSVALHEIGHALGAQHVEGTLMRPTLQRHYTCPDFATVVQVAAYHHAPLTEFSWCY